MARIHEHADPFEISIESLADTAIAVDAHLMLYREIKAKRGNRGKAIMNDDGEPISHILGVWQKTAYYLKNDITPVYVFEGGMPDLKIEENERRKERSVNARENYEKAKEEGDEEGMKRWGARAARLSFDEVDEVKELLGVMGVPVVEAPSEADPQCAQLNKEGTVEYVYTEDFDHLLHGADSLLRRLKRGKGEMVSRKQILDDLGYSHDQLVWRQIVAGCDYNNSPEQVAWGRAGGIIEGCESFEQVIESALDYCSSRDELAWSPDRWREVWGWFQEPEVDENVSIDTGYMSPSETRELLVDVYGLDSSRVQTQLRDIVEDR